MKYDVLPPPGEKCGLVHKHRSHRRDAKNAEKFFIEKLLNTLSSLRLGGERVSLWKNARQGLIN
jgi:hypothetical protein